jgi:vacuolar protein sorting-associated protein 1
MKQTKHQKGTNAFVQEIRARIDAYFRISVRNVRDSIPKAIGHFLVKGSQDKLQFELYAQINKNQAISEALGEPKHVTEERKTLNTTLEAMKKAMKIL